MFFQRSKCVCVCVCVCVCFGCFWSPRKVFQICEKSWFFTTSGSKKSYMSQNLCLGSTRLIFYENSLYFNQTNPRNVFYVEKLVQILHRSINNSKIYLKYTKTTDWMGRIRTVYLLCTRITLETTALRVTWKLRSRRSGVFPMVQVFLNGSKVPRGFFRFVKNRDCSPRLGQKKSSMSQTLWLLRTRLIFYEN